MDRVYTDRDGNRRRRRGDRMRADYERDRNERDYGQTASAAQRDVDQVVLDEIYGDMTEPSYYDRQRSRAILWGLLLILLLAFICAIGEAYVTQWLLSGGIVSWAP